MLTRVLFLSSIVTSTVADYCTTLARSLGPGVESYTSGRVCHGLFWVIPGASFICQHTSLTSSWCSDRYPVEETEARAIALGELSFSPVLANESDARQVLSVYVTDAPSTETTTPIPTVQPESVRRRQRRVYPVTRSAEQPPTDSVTPPTSAPVPEISIGVDVCRILHPESYETPSGLCHGLYWRTSDHSEFCYHSSETAIECPVWSGHEVSLGQAAEFIHQLNRETTSRPPRNQLSGLGYIERAADLDTFYDEDISFNRNARITDNIRALVDQ